MSSIIRYRENLADRCVREIRERNGGMRPATVGQMAALFERFGAKLRWVPADVLPEPIIRNGIVLMPDTRTQDGLPGGKMLLRWMAHELAEVVLAWEGTREYRGPGWSGDRHKVAALVERRLLSDN